MSLRVSLILSACLVTSCAAAAQSAAPVFGYADFAAQSRLEQKFLAVPDATLAGQHMKTLTAEPHYSGTPEDKKTAEYVAAKFRAAGLETEIVPYRVLLNYPRKVVVEAWDASGKALMIGPTKEHVEGDPYQDHPRAFGAFHGSSASGEVTAEVVYGNFCRIEDFQQLAALHVDVRGKVMLCRYGGNFRGVKVYIAEQRGAAGVLIYSDPAEDGFAKGDAYPVGPWRPETGVQRGSVQYMFMYPGDPETPGIASTLNLPDASRTPMQRAASQPRIVSIPLSYHDAQPILQAMGGAAAPKEWQGALPFRYHLGPSGVRVHLVNDQDYQRRIIWDVIGKIKGTDLTDETVIVGNHRDAWVYGAVDPVSGTAAMLEAVHGVGQMLKQGWHPRRTVIFASWDAEEQGLIGSTEWVEQHEAALAHAVAYFNTDVAVGGQDFGAGAVPSLKQFVRELTRDVPSPLGGTVYQQWRIHSAGDSAKHPPLPGAPTEEIHVGDLGSGSDFSPFFQHVGVPSTDISSDGNYGVYHSVFDNYAWFVKNADPHFTFLQEMARVLGLEALRMADADVLPYDYVTYAREIQSYLDAAHRKAIDAGIQLDFAPAQAAAAQMLTAAQRAYTVQSAITGRRDGKHLDQLLRQAEGELLSPAGLPNRPWFRHTIFAPGEYTGYAAVVLPGVSEALDAHDPARAAQQLTVLTQAIGRAARVLDQVQ